jgi:predicted NBD/HSP70 family sugar kinase
MATANPGRFAGGRGQLKPGSGADTLRFRWQNAILVEDVWLAGEQVYTRSEAIRTAWGAARTTGTLIYVTVSTGIGGGIVQSGQLYRGVYGAHPELCHHVIDPSGPLCYCGISGCWESLASGPAMSAWFREMDPERRPLTAAQICERAQQCDVLAVRAVRREAYYIGLGLANLVTLFAP